MKKKEQKKKQKVNTDKFIEKAFKENYSEKNSYMQSVGIFIFSVLIVISSGYFFYKAYYQYTPPTEFIVLDQNYRVLEESSLDTDVKNEELMVNTVNQWVMDMFSYHYLNIDKHGEKIKKYFSTESAYSEFMDVFNSLRLQDRVRALKAIVRPVVIEPIVISGGGIYEGYQRYYEMSGVFVIEVIGERGKEVIRYNIDLIIAKRSLTESPFGYGIEVIALR